MEILFRLLSTKAEHPKQENGLIYFCAPEPLIIHPGEIKKVDNYLECEVDDGGFLVITTDATLLNKHVCLFPAVVIMSGGFLNLSLHNCGKSQVNILPGNIIAVGRVVSAVPNPIEMTITPFLPPKTEKKPPVPKKGEKFRFDIR